MDYHKPSRLFCPECGQHEGDFLAWREDVKSEIYHEAPGQAELWLFPGDVEPSSSQLASLPPDQLEPSQPR